MTTFERIQNKTYYPTPQTWLSINTIDMHAGGEPLRVIVSGYPDIDGETVQEKGNYVKENLDFIRTTLIHEPRGHSDMYGCLLVPPNSDSDFGIIFMHNEGYSTMCGHATIAITKLAVEMGWVDCKEPETIIKIDAPCGRIIGYAQIKNGEVLTMSFDNVPSFVVDLDAQVDINGFGSISYDLAFGGAFYAFVDADELGIPLLPSQSQRLIELGMDIKRAVMDQSEMNHPSEKDLGFLYGTIFTGNPHGSADSRNVCIFANGELDRSPTGSGVSARLAIYHARGELKVGDSLSFESILGSIFVGTLKETVNYEGLDAVIPNVSGTAYITGQHQFIIDPNDPQKDGFILR